MLNITIRTNQYAKLAMLPKDQYDNPTPLDSSQPISAETDTGDARIILAPTAQPDGSRLIYIIPSDVAGVSTGHISGDADPTGEIEIIREDLTITALPPNAVSLGLSMQGFGQKSELPQEIKDML